MTTIPGRVKVSRASGQSFDADDARALRGLLDGYAHLPATFAAAVAPIEAFCRRVIARSGGVPIGAVPDSPPVGTVFTASGYAVEGGIPEASELDFALRVIDCMRLAREAPDRDRALLAAWRGGAIHAEAVTKFRWEAHALRGEKNLASTHTAGKARGEQKAQAATRNDTDIHGYARRWRMSDELQDRYSTVAEYIRVKMPELSRSTVYRRLKELKLSSHKRR